MKGVYKKNLRRIINATGEEYIYFREDETFYKPGKPIPGKSAQHIIALAGGWDNVVNVLDYVCDCGGRLNDFGKPKFNPSEKYNFMREATLELYSSTKYVLYTCRAKQVQTRKKFEHNYIALD